MSSSPQLLTATSVVPLREPNFLRENWKAVLGSSPKEEFRCVRVIGGVATLTNGSILLRSQISLPDGFYMLSAGNDLVPMSGGTNGLKWLSYPDVETCRPQFDRVQPSPLIGRDIVRELLDFSEVVRRQNSRYRSHIVMDKGGFFAADNLSFIMPFPILQSGEEILLDPFYLRLVLTEMLRYEAIHIARERDETRSPPIIFGLDWGHCALIRPLSARDSTPLGYH